MLRVHGSMFCHINLLYAFLCVRMTLRVQVSLRKCPRAGRFRATLLLHIVRMRSQGLWGFSGVVAYTQTNEQKGR